MSEPVRVDFPQTVQQDASIAHEAALALERAVGDPEALAITSAIYKNQHDQDIYFEAVEQEIKRKRFDVHLAGIEVFNKEGIEALLITEALKMQYNRLGASQGAIFLVIDIDGLKKINDQEGLGHPVGDKVIYGVAEALRKALRSTDDIGRYGGDEFIALLPLTEDNQELALKIIEEGGLDNSGQLQEGIREKFIGHLGINYQSLLKAYGDRWPEKKDGVVPGMASLGWHYFSREEFLNRYQAFLKSDEKGKLFSQMLMKEADEQLYEAKRARSITPASSPDVPPETPSS